jgi:hypothetical protein
MKLKDNKEEVASANHLSPPRQDFGCGKGVNFSASISFFKEDWNFV